MQRCSKLRTTVHGPSRIINKIGENAYRLKLLDDYDISPIFNVKYLRPYHGEDLRASLFSQLWEIDARAFRLNLGNSILIMENSDSGVCETLETPNIFIFPSILSLVTIFIWSSFILEIFSFRSFFI